MTTTDDPTANANDPTLADDRPATAHGLAQPRPSNYSLGQLLGRGGMGEVVLADDMNLHRQIAIKRMRAGTHAPEAIARFEREARIQGLLEHPAIVPVHELGRDKDDLPYFTMKRLTGKTLQEVLRDGDARLQRLLRAFIDVCLAIEYAHARKIVHRDLKPSNVMLGDYGEVYVLDWGVARMLDDIDPITKPTAAGDAQTQIGSILGTPGYMSPEQLRGETITTATDVYALGAILYEVLTGEPLHPRAEAIASTLAERPVGSLAKRFPDRAIAPELDEACVAALASNPAARPRASTLADRIQRYLDGDRDVERRRALARQLDTRARTALASGDRAEAMRTAGRALAFDPESTAASELVFSLVVDEPRVIPPEVTAAVDAEETKMMRTRSRRAILPYAAIFGMLPFLPLLHVADYAMLVAVYAAFAMMVLVTWLNSKYGVPIALTMIGHTLTALMFSRFIGPFVITPIMLCAILLSATSIPWLNKRWWAIVGWTMATVMLPFVLEWSGLLAPTWKMTPDGLLSQSTVFQTGVVQPGWIILGHVGAIVLVAAYGWRIGRDRNEAQRRMFLQAWHLRHLLPKTPLAQPSAMPR
jgi:hypothetical protein